MTSYYYQLIHSKQYGRIEIVYYLTGDVIITTNLNDNTTSLYYNDTVLPADVKKINYEDYIRLLTLYKCIK